MRLILIALFAGTVSVSGFKTHLGNRLKKLGHHGGNNYGATTDYGDTDYGSTATKYGNDYAASVTDYATTATKYGAAPDYSKTETKYDPVPDYTKYDAVPDYGTKYETVHDYATTATKYEPAPDYTTKYDPAPDYATKYETTPDYTTKYDPAPDYSTSSKYTTYDKPSISPETRSIEELYKAALAEGGKLIIYAGGDAPQQQTGAKTAFEDRFPGIKVEMIVDYSKIHDARLDNQLATGTLVADVVQLQTLHDFDRWRDQGVLHPYKPLGWEEVYPEFKDPHGYSVGIHVWSFANNVNRDVFGDDEANWPLEARDYLDPALKGKIISTYPNDDDAVLFHYKLFIDKYGWEWLERFVANHPVFVRSTQIPFDLLRNGNGSFPVSFTTAGSIKPRVTSPVQFVLPKYDPFVSWGQRAAIMKGTKYLATAQLYLSWWLEIETQQDFWFQWSVRKDVPAPAGFKKIMEYPEQTDPVAFEKFMGDRKALEIFKNQVQLYVGEVVGEIPTGTWELGRHPTKMLDVAFDRK